MNSATTPTIAQTSPRVRYTWAGVLTAFLVVLAGGAVALADQETPCGLSAGFIENRGQVDAAVRYYVSGPLASVYFTDEAVILDLKGNPAENITAREYGASSGRHDLSRTNPHATNQRTTDRQPRRGCAVWLRFEAANSSPTIVAHNQLTAQYNYLIGNDPTKWQTKVPAYTEITYRDLWPGIDLVYRIDGGRVAYDLVAARGADMSRVNFRYDGAAQIDQTPEGAFLVATPVGDIVDVRPVPGTREGVLAWAGVPGLHDPAAGDSQLSDRAGVKAVSGLIWSSYLPGSGYDYSEDIALDATGAPVVTGRTDSSVFPTSAGAYDITYNGGTDVFVAKLNAAGNALLWGTYIGSSGDEGGQSIVFDTGGNPVVVGNTWSATFPTTAGAWDQTHNGLADVFIAKLAADGSSLLWSTFLGGSGTDELFSGGMTAWIANGNTLVVCGSTTSADFITTSGAYDRTHNGNTDLFVTKLGGAGNVISWSTYIGGTNWDEAWGLAVDSADNLVLTGKTDSTDFPTTAGAYNQTHNGASPGDFDAYVAKLNSTGTALMWGTYLGGSQWEEGRSLALDSLDQPVMTGYTFSADFPTSYFAYDSSLDGAVDVYVTQLDAAGALLTWSTYLGGSNQDNGHAVAVGPTGNVIVTGIAYSADFPTTPGAFSQTLSLVDAFVSELGGNGSTLLSSTFLGGSGWDGGRELAIDSFGDVIVVGDTDSADFPTTAGAYATVYNFASDIFVTKLGMSLPAAPWMDMTSPPVDAAGNGRGVCWGDYDNDGDLDLYLVNYRQTNRLFRNDGNYTFVDVSGGSVVSHAGWGVSAAWGDHDNDGDLDLYLVNENEANSLFGNNGDGTFWNVTTAPLDDAGTGRGMAWGDYDNDGDLDIYLANYGQSNRLFRNDGGGSFTDVTAAPLNDAGNGMGVAWGDYDNDGNLDLYLSNDGQANKLFRNLGGGTFSDMTSFPLDDAGSGSGVAWGDFDNDGFLDLYLANHGQANRLMQNIGGGGLFVDATTPLLGDTGNGTGVALGDYDNDGDLDIYLANNGQANKLFDNVANLQFVDVTGSLLGDTGAGMGVAWGDCNNDADLDLYLANDNNQTNKLFRNNTVWGKSTRSTKAMNNWLHVKLKGSAGSVGGIGARVRVDAGGISQIREISGGSGFCSQNSLTAAFGLGSATVADIIHIRWPDGAEQTLLGVSPGRTVIVIGPPLSAASEPPEQPRGRYDLHGNFPNPFNPQTVIRFSLPAAQPYRLTIYDTAGRLVHRFDAQGIAGANTVTWYGRSQSGVETASGIYFYRLQAGSYDETRKMTLLR